MTAFQNHSMIEDERLDRYDKLRKKFRTNFFDGMYTTVGHVFTIMVEVLEIKNLSIELFIIKLNEYIEIDGNDFAKVSNAKTQFYSRTINKLAWYLKGDFPNITKEQFNTIMEAAYPPHPY